MIFFHILLAINHSLLHISTTPTQAFNVLMLLVSVRLNLLLPPFAYTSASSLQYQSHQLCHLPVCSPYSSLLVISTQIQDHSTVSMSLMQTSDPSTTNTLPLQNLFLTTTLISSPCPRPGLDLTSQVPTCPESPHKVTILINSHVRAVAEEDLVFCERWLRFFRCFHKDLHYL